MSFSFAHQGPTLKVLDCRALSPGIAKPQVCPPQGDSQEVMGEKRSSPSMCCYKWIMGWAAERGSRNRSEQWAWALRWAWLWGWGGWMIEGTLRMGVLVSTRTRWETALNPTPAPPGASTLTGDHCEHRKAWCRQGVGLTFLSCSSFPGWEVWKDSEVPL